MQERGKTPNREEGFVTDERTDDWDPRSDAVVAILSLGSDRTLLLRPNGGGRSIAFAMHSGDLLVQGGTCQRTFEHCVPKMAYAAPRLSLSFRHH